MSTTVTGQPIASFKRSFFSIRTYGGHTADSANLITDNTAIEHIVRPPSGPGQPGFQTIATYPTERTVVADGILITPSTVVGITSADCPILVLMDERSGCGVAAHCGRPAMTKRQLLMRRNYNVIAAALNIMKQHGSPPTKLSAYITAGICQDCFTHDLRKPHDAELLRPFPKVFVINGTGGLDLVGLITSELVQAGVLSRNITSDKLCTKEHPGLVSSRGGKVPGAVNYVIIDTY
jgi:copper oxidase (laccase) domain-containing protein